MPRTIHSGKNNHEICQVVIGFGNSSFLNLSDPAEDKFKYISDSVSFFCRYDEVITKGSARLIAGYCKNGMIALETSALPEADRTATDILQFGFTDDRFLLEADPEMQPPSSDPVFFFIRIEPWIRGMNEWTYRSADDTTNSGLYAFDFENMRFWDTFFYVYESLRRSAAEGITLHIEKILYYILERLVNQASRKQRDIRIEEFLIIRQSIDLIKQDLTKKYTLEEVVNIFQINKTRYCRIFQAITEKSFSTYYTQIRMERAFRLLYRRETDSIHQVSIQLGFNNSQEFSRAFVKYYGYTPNFVYRNEHNSLPLS